MDHAEYQSGVGERSRKGKIGAELARVPEGRRVRQTVGQQNPTSASVTNGMPRHREELDHWQHHLSECNRSLGSTLV